MPTHPAARAILLLGLFSTSLRGQAVPSGAIRFQDISTQAGLTTVPYSSMKQRYVVESTAGGIALFDCDNDGRLDIVVVNDSTIDRAHHGGAPMVTLYHQDAKLKFTDITKAAGLTRRGWGMGIAIGDYDNDGLPDIYVTGYGRNVLYHNLGNCKFEDVTERNVVGAGGYSTGAAWSDYDRDGHLDLFVARYVHTTLDQLPTPGSNAPNFFYKGIRVESPWTMHGENDLLFHNRGDGTFEEVSKKAGMVDPDQRNGMGVVWGDYDNDGWPDLYVANDGGPNFLYRNKHDGTFEDVGLLAGVSLGQDGQQFGSMGVDFGDFDRDGRLDVVVTNFANQPKELYWNRAAGGFTDLTWDSHIGRVSQPYVGWGTGFVDFDNDGLPDILMANGHIYPEVDTIAYEPKYRQPFLLFRNLGDRTFEETSASSGLNEGAPQSRRGVALGDVNNDGNIDFVVFNVGAAPSLFLNQTRNSNHRVLFKLIGKKSNRAAIGARITVSSATRSQMEEVRGGSSYLSSNDQRLHFGLGSDKVMGTVEIRWPNGNVEILHNVAADAIYTVVEGEGITGTIGLPVPGAP
jgi:enediyne biosynthesis protein E4